jgi:GH15 family glucan-1,4-alpha-glucosidase
MAPWERDFDVRRHANAAAAPLIEDHALIGDLGTAALVASDGTIDFLCLPDFDSDACFASLLGTNENGYWKLSPAVPVRARRRRYRDHTLVLESEMDTDDGTVRLVDFMPVRSDAPHVVRMVEGLTGEVLMQSDIVPRFTHGLVAPLVAARDGATAAVAGADCLSLRVAGERAPEFGCEFTVKAGQCVTFALSWSRPYSRLPEPVDASVALEQTQAYWRRWCARLRLPSEYAAIVERALVTVKACTYAPSGAVVSAPTFGLPEVRGGERNWDYRYCWVRDTASALRAFIRAGLRDEAAACFQWLVDAAGGAPSQMQPVYGIRGDRLLPEVEVDWLGGYEGSRPVRVGNAASEKVLLDAYGEFATAVHEAAWYFGTLPPRARSALKAVAASVARLWRKNDGGIWEVRGPERPFTASKVAAWAAVSAWIRVIEEHHLDEEVSSWLALRKTIFDDIRARGYDPEQNAFTQYYGSTAVDASLLQIPLSGLLPAADARVSGTVAAIERDLVHDGLVRRYGLREPVDGLTGTDGAFLPCSFWLASTYQLMGRRSEARLWFEKAASPRNDLGLLAEEYLPKERRLAGNFPHTPSHLALAMSAYLLDSEATP